jgi:methyl-accepting chemotaxis protein
MALITLAALAIGVTSYWSSSFVTDHFSRAFEASASGVAAAADVEAGVLMLSNLDRGIALGRMSGDTALVTRLSQDFDLAANRLDGKLDALNGFLTTGDAADYRLLRSNFSAWRRRRSAPVSEIFPFAGPMLDAARGIRVRCQQSAELQRAAAMAAGDRSRSLVCWLFCAAAALAIVPFLVIPKIIRLLVSLENVIGELGEGKLTARLPENSGGPEVRRLAAALNRSIRTLSDAMQAVRHEAGSLIQSADELSGISEEMTLDSEASERQAFEVSGAAQGIAARIAGVAEASRALVASVEEVLQNSADAYSMADETNRVVTLASGMTEELKRVTGEIGGIVDIVRTVAHQTNLIALNAAIEAARVGEPGKGFAVVANEIRSLASETARAVKQMLVSIETARKFTASVARHMESVSRQTAQMNVISNDIAGLVAAQTAAVREIEQNATVVSAQAQTIADAMTGAVETAHMISSHGSRTQSAASKLRLMAHTVGDSIGRFELAEDDDLNATS